MVDFPQLLISDSKGKIINVPFLEATGMKAGYYYRFHRRDLMPLPYGSQLYMLPNRLAVAFDPHTKQIVNLDSNPLSKKEEPCFAVAAFLAPGYTAKYSASYEETSHDLPALPLFAYAPVVFYKGDFFTSAVRVDRELRQDCRYFDMKLIGENVAGFKKQFPKNRLIVHLENCALVNNCPAAKNFFQKRYEGPLPTSPSCNSRCLGCISFQPDGLCPSTQQRICFKPSPEEIAETALFHMQNVDDPVVSFGQGCEGEPLLAFDVIEPAIRLIRRKTTKGMINLNTNASDPFKIEKLFTAGLDSIRVSINSLQPEFYQRYYRPKNYAFMDVMNSIKAAKKKGAFVSINYLLMPGFTDSTSEFAAFQKFLAKYPINMIQWRNMNFDPKLYFKFLKFSVQPEDLLGIDHVIKKVHDQHPEIMKGYFNPSKKRIQRFQARGKK